MAETTYDPKAEYFATRRIRHTALGKHFEAAKKDDKGNHIAEETFTLEHLEPWQIAYLVEGQKAVAPVTTTAASASSTKTKETKS